MKSIALIPARSGSKRINDKNILPINSHPLIAYTIAAAIESKIFDSIVCVTDSYEYAQIAQYYGAEVPSLRPHYTAQSNSPDINWVKWILKFLNKQGRSYDIFSILRPTSPLRGADAIKQAYQIFRDNREGAHSLRAVELCKQHPGKMWKIEDKFLKPLINETTNDGTPFHSNQYDALPKFYVQNASLEIAWVNVIKKFNTISGTNIIPFLSDDLDGFDVNYPEDIERLNSLVVDKKVSLPLIRKQPYNVDEK